MLYPHFALLVGACFLLWVVVGTAAHKVRRDVDWPFQTEEPLIVLAILVGLDWISTTKEKISPVILLVMMGIMAGLGTVRGIRKLRQGRPGGGTTLLIHGLPLLTLIAGGVLLRSPLVAGDLAWAAWANALHQYFVLYFMMMLIPAAVVLLIHQAEQWRRRRAALRD